ncbi:MAG: 2-amino-4-hydroxy-6-hydroxymethyldihydropteridine diphosphokinase [Elusimicrobia bacterium]|nr:2-amino-4-hydroxy-6-hydroxymethyldihydropteridine diphosphokinase [Elusimicrobiota bacterium]
MAKVKQLLVAGRWSLVKTAYLGLGSNIGNKRENIKEAIRLLRQEVKIAKMSSYYKTKPVGYADQPDFINVAIEIKTNLTPLQLLRMVKDIEKKIGRKKTFQNGPRIIDIDILIYYDEIMKTKKLVIPHPDMHRRWFVLKPLAEIAPEVIHPTLKHTIKNLFAKLKD